MGIGRFMKRLGGRDTCAEAADVVVNLGVTLDAMLMRWSSRGICGIALRIAVALMEGRSF